MSEAENMPGSWAAPDLRIDYAKELNPAQCAAVTAPPGPALVIAGAGSGKTRVLTYRVAFLLEQGIPPERILLLTFTNRAAREMMERVTRLLGRELPDLWGGTFHSIGHRFLRRHAAAAGCQPNFTILDREDAEKLLAQCVEELKLDETGRFPKKEVLASLISLAANAQETIAQVIGRQFSWLAESAGDVQSLAGHYQARKRAGNLVDFDDLLALWLALLEKDAGLRERYQRQFQFILIDEYQDTNRLQNALVELLAGRHQNILAVGDDAQSIYSWRGAHFLNILEFPKRHPTAQVYKIETNYRSTPEILDVANESIARNVHQHPKDLSAERRSGLKPVYVKCLNSRQQAVLVASQIHRLWNEEGVPLGEMAILYRSHFHAMDLQLELRQRQIPAEVTSGVPFFEQAHVKDVAAHLRLVNNPEDEFSFLRVAQLMPGIGQKSARKLWGRYRDARRAFGAGPDRALDLRGLEACEPLAPAKGRAAWKQFTETMRQLHEKAPGQPPADLIGLVLDAGYSEYLKLTFANASARLEDLRGLKEYARKYLKLDDFLGDLALQTSLTEPASAASPPRDQAVRLSTIHQAKGLEFSVVFLIMLCENFFPSAPAVESGREEVLEEERRLFYVAVTRAKDFLFLVSPLIPNVRDADHRRALPSRFVGELSLDKLEEVDLTTCT